MGRERNRGQRPIYGMSLIARIFVILALDSMVEVDAGPARGA